MKLAPDVALRFSTDLFRTVSPFPIPRLVESQRYRSFRTSSLALRFLPNYEQFLAGWSLRKIKPAAANDPDSIILHRRSYTSAQQTRDSMRGAVHPADFLAESAPATGNSSAFFKYSNAAGSVGK